jgi:hypothetical protein
MAKPTNAKEAGAIALNPRARTIMPIGALSLPPQGGTTPTAPTDRPTALNLSGKRKAVFLIGRGRIGKTMLGRWIAETMTNRGGSAVIGAADPLNRSLTKFLNDVMQPPSSDPVETKDWLNEVLETAMVEGYNCVMDLGGGDTSLGLLLQEIPHLADVLSEGGLEPVALHVIGGNIDDLTPLAMMERAGFQPKATAIIANEAHGRRGQFESVLTHPEVQATLDRGSVQLWMPSLAAVVAKNFDEAGWRFHDARAKTGPFAAAAVEAWLRRMAEELAPIASWMPE